MAWMGHVRGRHAGCGARGAIMAAMPTALRPTPVAEALLASLRGDGQPAEVRAAVDRLDPGGRSRLVAAAEEHGVSGYVARARARAAHADASAASDGQAG